MKTNINHSKTYTYQLDRKNWNSNYKLEFFLNSLQTNQQFRHYLLATTLVMMAVIIVAGVLLIPLGIKIIGWISGIA